MSDEVKGTGMSEHRCMRPGCGRKLTSAKSIAAGYGPVCLARIRNAAATVELPGVKPAQHDKALELIADGGIVPTSRPGVFAAVSSDGTTTYLTDAGTGTCTCKAGQAGRYCYHLAAAAILTAASTRRAA